MQRSFHRFHAIAVKDRVDFSSLSDRAPCLSSLDYDVTSLLPSELDIDIIKEEMAILISSLRLQNHIDSEISSYLTCTILIQHLEEFSKREGCSL